MLYDRKNCNQEYELVLCKTIKLCTRSLYMVSTLLIFNTLENMLKKKIA